MKIGMPNLIETPTLEDTIELCKKVNLDFIELNMNFPAFQLDTLNVDKLNKYTKENGIEYTIHLDENFDTCSFNKHISNAYLKTLQETILLAKMINATKINMHLSKGIFITLPDRKEFLYETYFDNYIKSIKFLKEQSEKWIGGSDITICIENTDGYKDFHKKAIDEFLTSKHFALTLDVGHSHCVNDIDLPFILERKDKLKHIHLHDASKSCHLALGDGSLNIKKYINLAQETNSTVVLETKTIEALKKSTDYINTNFRNIT